MQKFNLEAALKGAKVVTRSGLRVTDISKEEGISSQYVVNGLVEGDPSRTVLGWSKEGRWEVTNPDKDLFMVDIGQKHIHHVEIKAWADGAKIECQQTPSSVWFSVSDPYWKEALKYRVKPETRELFSVADDNGTYFVLDRALQPSRLDGCKGLITVHSKYHQAFDKESDAQAVAEYLQKNFWFIRKAIEFAEGYKFKNNKPKYKVTYNYRECKWLEHSTYNTKPNTTIYMTQTQVSKFIKWLEEFAPNGELIT